MANAMKTTATAVGSVEWLPSKAGFNRSGGGSTM